eukprot:CAMPEP_0119133098 /NCGR_PEP_ID=MMETSP1310-20130426/12963_1 /TAXON_ID=464262 /ORGANISM="Genus nov. species nov., Strain RCC2339" /LENGTH=377 /DNA_ID=CAMNT_0007123773 /DNA_START=68 /DNA_END=1201 /DNA_ORIENTATION=-
MAGYGAIVNAPDPSNSDSDDLSSGDEGLLSQEECDEKRAKRRSSLLYTKSPKQTNKTLFDVLFPDGYGPKDLHSADFPEYQRDWWHTYDMALLVGMVAFGIILAVLTTSFYFSSGGENVFDDLFWLNLLISVVVMFTFSFLGGLLVTRTGLRPNYTRKIQHFAAYIVPLIMDRIIVVPYHNWGEWLLQEAWGYYVVMLSFTIMIYPIRTASRFVDLMFLALDRVEDRPYTLKWITGQIMIGDTLLVIGEGIIMFILKNELATNLVFIPTLIVGFGDGLAEPVGITWGKHKYRARACCSSRKYTRSFEGSFTVYISGVIACAAFYPVFANWHQFLAAIVVIPPVMTVAEAISPHTFDTPFMMLTGISLIIAISYIPPI